MLHVYHSNRLEALCILLCSLRESRPPADPITPETVLVANPGIGRWLNFQIANRSGIAANIDYMLPATFVWQLYRNCLDDVPEQSAFEKGALRLRVLHELTNISSATDKVWVPLQRYLDTDGGAVGDAKRVQLASRIADVFDQYLVYRPQMLLSWEQGADTVPGNDPAQRWQPALWRFLVTSANEYHRARLWQQFCSRADKGQIDADLLPPHLHLFNVGLLPPSTLDVLVRLSKITSADAERVSLYFLNPAVDYWADLLDMRRAARERLKLSTASEPLADDQIGNPLLSSLGGSGRTLMKLLGDRSEWVHDEHFFLPADDQSLLAAVQRDLLHPYDNTTPNNKLPHTTDDESIQLHQCYSPLREVQALHDRLLDRFNADDTLEPADILVMVPDINTYAPVVEAVFGSVGAEPGGSGRARHIPWSVADRSLVQVSQVIACVERLFQLPGFEFEATGVLAFAAEPAIARRFGFDENALKTLSQWLLESGVRRTLAGQHNKLLQAPTADLHSWDFGLRRLLLGRAMPESSLSVGECLPWTNIDGQQAVLLSQLLNLLEALADTQKKLQSARSAADWVDAINDMVARFLLPDEQETDALAQFRELLASVDNDALQAGNTNKLSHATFAEILRGVLAGAEQKNHRYLTGRVTFSSMVPLRSVPFRVVCMLGLNDSDFPRQRPKLGFDLVALHPQQGDRSIRDDDRYLFLEALLSARDELYLSWVYRNLNDNAEREPSVLVSELRDYLKKRYPSTEPRCIEHPLQPFSNLLFDPTVPALHTFAAEWAPPVEAPDVVSLADTGLPPATELTISIDDFQRFWRNPSDWFCRRVLGVALWREEKEPDDAEPFDIDALSAYGLRNEVFEFLMAQAQPEKNAAYTHLTHSGVLPHGGLGQVVFESASNEAQDMLARVNQYEATVLAPLDIDINIQHQSLPARLHGRLHGVVEWADKKVGLRHCRPSSLKGNQLVTLWLAHLVGSAAGVLTGPARLIAKDTERELRVVSREDALIKLQPWLAGWQQGQTSALPFFGNTSAAIAGAVKGNLETLWSGSSFGRPGECEHEAIQLLYPDIHRVPGREDVHNWALALMGDEVLVP